MSDLLDRLHHGLRSVGHRTVVAGAFGAIDGVELEALIAGYTRRAVTEGIGPDDVVACIARPGPRMLALLAALLARGARVVLCDPRMGTAVVGAQLDAAGVHRIIAEPNLWRLNRLAPRRAERAGLRVPDFPAERRSLGAAFGTGAPAFLPRTGEGPGAPIAGAELVIFTSGTIGEPRGVVHTMDSIRAGVDAVTALIDPTSAAVVAGNQFFVLLPALCAGASVMLLTGDPRRDARTLRSLRPSVTYLTPPALRRVLDCGGSDRWLEGRVFTGSTPVSVELLRAAKAAGADEAWDVYALTEAFPVAAIEADQKAHWEQPGDLVGPPTGEVTVGISEAGELLVAGPNVSPQYLGALPHSEVATGDRAQLADGAIVLEGRLKDMFLVDAENVYPGLYEPSLRVPGVAEVLLVGVGADPGDQTPVLVVECTANTTERAVSAQLAPRLAVMGRARPVRVVFAEIPRAGRNAKPDRTAAATLAAAHLTASAS